MAVVAQNWLRLPVVAAGAEYLVMGHLMRRNILAYKAPQNNEGYDLICIHSDPRHRPMPDQVAQMRVQVKSRFQTDCNREFPLRKESLDAFDFLIVVFLNIGRFYSGRNGSAGEEETEFYTLPRSFVQQHHNTASSFHKVRLKSLANEIVPFKNSLGFELIARRLGIPRPQRSSYVRKDV
jgi:hypothetical protein